MFEKKIDDMTHDERLQLKAGLESIISSYTKQYEDLQKKLTQEPKSQFGIMGEAVAYNNLVFENLIEQKQKILESNIENTKKITDSTLYAMDELDKRMKPKPVQTGLDNLDSEGLIVF